MVVMTLCMSVQSVHAMIVESYCHLDVADFHVSHERVKIEHVWVCVKLDSLCGSEYIVGCELNMDVLN